ncbi:hypothetical protein SISSUDRAFT_994071 [Sistotremastrum suecicum HHB10207 ss-3]|uniref:Glycosyl transferase CAP10 domain-containing protein n=1 Tax=Sistotremastrum suecicum HHB10207 ss-3 TaxID=1314776 RepID=A0A165XPE5_9AGAM|nr:hypothetical protein SISSUDRAFT_994071 [Sistotremastrum suecicum HHB10207 ss-3]
MDAPRPGSPVTPVRKPKTPTVATGKHTYRPDGLLQVNPAGRHPIIELTDHAQKVWNDKLATQSRTLKDAVAEYKRRYGRKPPKGFDKWWDFVVKHKVQLPDEYDQIWRNIEPFWGVDPRDLQELQREAEKREDTYTIINDEQGMRAINPLDVPRAEDQMAVMRLAGSSLPHFRATMSIHDGPGHVISYEHREALKEAAAEGGYIDIHDPPQSTTHGWAANCAHGSPLRHPSGEDEEHDSPSRTFIYNHYQSMDPCTHPSHVLYNGFLASHREGPGPHPTLIPTFAICSTAFHADILTVAPEQWMEEVDDPIEWDQKSDERILWRGSNTGILFQDDMPWNSSQRVRLMSMVSRRDGFQDVYLPPRKGEEEAPVGEEVRMRAGRLNNALMDIAFAGEPIQCGEGRACEEVRAMFDWRNKQQFGEANVYKYVMDIDGNGWSARFKRLMTSKSLVFKTTIHPEWYQDRVMPWLHYVPIQNDFSDLYDAMLFFHGDLNAEVDQNKGGGGEGRRGHDEIAKRIAMEGRKWSLEFWRMEDMCAYQFRLMLEYARIMAVDREKMSFDI